MPINARDEIRNINNNSIKGGRVKNLVNFFEGGFQGADLISIHQTTSPAECLQASQGNEISGQGPNRENNAVMNSVENKQQNQSLTVSTPNQCSVQSPSLIKQSCQKRQTEPALAIKMTRPNYTQSFYHRSYALTGIRNFVYETIKFRIVVKYKFPLSSYQ